MIKMSATKTHNRLRDPMRSDKPALLLEIAEPVFCAVCYSTQETVLRDRELGIGEVCCVLEDEQEPPCECVQIDVDRDDARFCPLHGPHSESARREREQEVADLAAYYSR